MALAELMARLEQEAQSQADAFRRQADVEVQAIELETSAAIADATVRHAARARAGRQVVLRRERAEAARQARARELEARHALVARVLSRAAALYGEIATSREYIAALPGHAEDALSYVEGLPSRIRCHASSIEAIQPVVARHDGVVLVADDTIGPGVVVETEDGVVVIDNTLETRVARVRDRLAIALAQGVDRAGA